MSLLVEAFAHHGEFDNYVDERGQTIENYEHEDLDSKFVQDLSNIQTAAHSLSQQPVPAQWADLRPEKVEEKQREHLERPVTALLEHCKGVLQAKANEVEATEDAIYAATVPKSDGVGKSDFEHAARLRAESRELMRRMESGADRERFIRQDLTRGSLTALQSLLGGEDLEGLLPEDVVRNLQYEAATVLVPGLVEKHNQAVATYKGTRTHLARLSSTAQKILISYNFDVEPNIGLIEQVFPPRSDLEAWSYRVLARSQADRIKHGKDIKPHETQIPL